VSYRYRAAETFWVNFYALSPSQKESVRRAWQIFKDDLRVVFYIEADTVWSVDVGTHALYR
jgi:hypothetical protein